MQGSPVAFSQPTLPYAYNFPHPYRRASSHLSSTDALPWSSAQQKSFENHIVQPMASADLSLSWADNGEFISFVDELLPAAKCPSWKVLMQQHIQSAIAEF